MKLKPHVAWIVAAALFGALALPWLVYQTGVRLLGAYGPGGVGAFYRDFIADILHLQPAALALFLGPPLLVLAWRLLVAYAWGSKAT